jgi:hypothetical protein
MEKLAELADGADAKATLSAIVSEYRAWIETQSGTLKDLSSREADSQGSSHQCPLAAQRVEAGIDALNDADVLYPFKLANRCMARAARRREAILRQTTPDKVEPPRWRPFQRSRSS